MNKEWTIQLRRYAAVFLIPTALALGLGAVYLVVDQDWASMVYLPYMMVAWVALLGYSVYELFAFFFLGRSVLLQLSPRSRGYTLFMLATVFIVPLLPLFAVGLGVSLIHLGKSHYDSLPWVIAYSLGSKVVGLIAFFALACALIGWLKYLRSTLFAALALIIVYAGICVAHGALDREAHHARRARVFVDAGHRYEQRRPQSVRQRLAGDDRQDESRAARRDDLSDHRAPQRRRARRRPGANLAQVANGTPELRAPLNAA